MANPQPRPEAAAAGAALALENADRHVKSAELLAQGRLFGPAISHLVLGLEEAVKAKLLMLHSQGIPSPDTQVEPTSRSHSKRLAIARLEQLLGWVYPAELLRRLGIPNGDSWGELIRRRLPTEEELNWLEEANQRKQDGFYVDYEGSEWRSPADLLESDYTTARRSTLRVIESIKQTIA